MQNLRIEEYILNKRNTWNLIIFLGILILLFFSLGSFLFYWNKAQEELIFGEVIDPFLIIQTNFLTTPG